MASGGVAAYLAWVLVNLGMGGGLGFGFGPGDGGGPGLGKGNGGGVSTNGTVATGKSKDGNSTDKVPEKLQPAHQ